MYHCDQAVAPRINKMPDRHETKHRKKHQSKRAPSKTETVTGHDQLAEHLPRVDDKVEVKEITIRPGSETGTFYLVLDNVGPLYPRACRRKFCP